MRVLAAVISLILMGGGAYSAVLVDVPLDQQIDIGLGDAISGHTSFETDSGVGFARRALTTDNGGGGWYFGPTVDLVKAGYGPCVDMSGANTIVKYTARYFQGGGNTDPYSDANISVMLIDSEGRSAGLGMSYGPSPSPTYPEWIVCADDTSTLGNWPSDAGFDISRVTCVQFFGTDWAGVGNDFVDFRDLKVVSYDSGSIGSIKSLDDDESVDIAGVVTAVFDSDDCFYLLDSTMCSGIQVRWPSAPAVGARLFVSGQVKTDETTGEMYIQATDVQAGGTGEVKPVGMTSRSLGGGRLGRQCGVVDGSGLSNVGLLVRIAGHVTGVSDGDIYLSDGAPLSDGGEYEGVRVDMSTVPECIFPDVSVGDPVMVTGISSIRGDAGGLGHRTIRLGDRSDFRSLKPSGEPDKTLRALVLNFDPRCPGSANALTHEVFGWTSPTELAAGYVSDLLECSGGWSRYEVVDWYDADYHPICEDGFQYSPDDYVAAWNNRGTTPMHDSRPDYVRITTDTSYPHNQPSTIAQRIASGEIDEVFMFSAPGSANGWEATMVGPSPFFVNGGTYTVPASARNFVIMGFNYERGVGEMLEDFCHRTECVMSRVYDPSDWWLPTWPVTNNWDAFRMYDQIYSGSAACGICHYAPNSESDYDWGNPAYVYSTSDDWLYNWPNLKGDVTRRLMNCNEWGNGDTRLHHKWWLNHLPKAPGLNADGKQNNWWKYTCDFNSYPESQ